MLAALLRKKRVAEPEEPEEEEPETPLVIGIHSGALRMVARLEISAELAINIEIDAQPVVEIAILAEKL